MAVADNAASSVLILLGTRTGSFGAPTNFAVGAEPFSVVTGDFNGDAKNDLAVANTWSNNVSILLGTGTGSFGAPANFKAGTPGSYPLSQALVTNISADHPTWSPDGKRIAFCGQDSATFKFDVYTINADGSNLLRLTNDATQDNYATWSPDGSRIAFMRAVEGSSWEIFSISPDGSNLKNLTNHPGFDREPSWSPDGTKIVFMVGANESGELYLMNADGSNQRLLTNGPNNSNTTAKDAISSVTAEGLAVNGSKNPDWQKPVGTAISPDPNISINDMTVTEGNNPGTNVASFTVTLSSIFNQQLSVSYGTTQGTASPGSDFGMVNGTLTFAPGETSKSISVPVNDDPFDEFDETFTVKLSNPTAGTIIRGQATCTILDDDPQPTISISPTGSLAEGDTGVLSVFSFSLELSKESEKPITIDYATADGTAMAGTDYQAASGSVTFPPGQTLQVIRILVVGDTVNEPNETFSVNLSNPVNVTIQQAQATTTISNEDTPTVRFEQPGYTVPEGAGFVKVAVVRTGDTSAPATVKYSTDDPTDANFRCDPTTAGQMTGTASRKCDYHISVGTLRFAAGEMTKQSAGRLCLLWILHP